MDEKLLIDFSEVSSSDYVTFLVIIATVGGVFIGLHYAGMSTLNGSLYSKLPTKVRNLLIQEKFGNIYIDFLSFLTYVAIILIVFRLYGFECIYIVPFVMSIGVGVAIYAFVDLGKRVFYLFDPTILSSVVFDNFFSTLDNVKKGALYYSDNSFQQHNHNLARENIDTLVVLLTLAKEESQLSADSLVRLQEDLMGHLTYYQAIKHKIPSNSLWYEQRYKHKDWYKIDDSTTNIYYQTASLPQADVVYDYFWVENRVLSILIDGISVNLKNKRFDVVKRLLNSYLLYLEQMVVMEEFEFSIEQTDKLITMIIGAIKEKESDKNELEILGIFEMILSMPIAILIAFFSNIDKYSYESTSKKLKLIDWNIKESLYDCSFDSYLLPELEELFKKLQYEHKIEDRVVSSHWYQLEIIMLFVSKRFIKNINLLVSIFQKIYKNTYDELDDLKHAYFKASILAKEWEYLNKLQYQFFKIEDILQEYRSKRKIATLNWRSIDIDMIKTRLKDIEKEILFDMSKSSFLVTDKTNNYPDFGGMFLHIIGEGLIDALCNNDIEMFEKIFPLYFYEAIIKFEMLKPSHDNQQWVVEQEFKVAVTPVIDLMEISGYAKLLCAYFNDERYWETVTSTWDKYLENQKELKPEFFASLISFNERGFGIPHRSANRIRWQQKIESLFDCLPTKEFYRTKDGFGLLSPIIIIEHDSPLVRVFAEKSALGRYSFYDGIDIFITYYIKNLDNTNKLSFGRRDHRDLEDKIEHEKSYYQKYMEENNEN